jgi:hypothetical protein
VTTREPEWTDQDRVELLALAEYRRLLCGCGCGHLAEDTTSHYETGPEFVAKRITCRARAALQEAQRAAAETGSDDNGARLWWTEIQRR